MVPKLEGLGFAVELRTAFEVTRQKLDRGLRTIRLDAEA